jgi:hypothetical protein
MSVVIKQTKKTTKVTKNKCSYVFIKGPKKGKRCNRNCKNDLCKDHNKNRKAYEKTYYDTNIKTDIKNEIDDFKKKVNEAKSIYELPSDPAMKLKNIEDKAKRLIIEISATKVSMGELEYDDYLNKFGGKYAETKTFLDNKLPTTLNPEQLLKRKILLLRKRDKLLIKLRNTKEQVKIYEEKKNQLKTIKEELQEIEDI